MDGEIARELEELGTGHSIDDLEICSMIWFVITDEETDLKEEIMPKVDAL